MAAKGDSITKITAIACPADNHEDFSMSMSRSTFAGESENRNQATIYMICVVIMSVGITHWYYSLVLLTGITHWYYSLVLLTRL